MGRLVGSVRPARVGNVELAFVERESEAIRPHHVGYHSLDLSGRGVGAVHVGGSDLALGLVALVVGLDAVGGIGKPDRAIRFHNDVVWRIEALAAPIVSYGGDAAVVLGAADAPARMLAGDEPSFAIDSVAIGVVARLAKDADLSVRFVIAKHPVVRYVGPDQIAAGRKIGRSLRPTASGEKLVHLRTGVEQS